MSLSVFLPVSDGTNVNIAVDVASARIQVTSAVSGGQVRLMNSGTNVVFVKFGDSTVVATNANLALLPNSVEVFTVPGNCPNLYVAAIAAASGNTLYISAGDGV